jgi:hypothetical protein
MSSGLPFEHLFFAVLSQYHLYDHVFRLHYDGILKKIRYMDLNLCLIVIDIVGPPQTLFLQDLLYSIPGRDVTLKETNGIAVIPCPSYLKYYPDVFHNILLLLVIQAISRVTETFPWEALWAPPFNGSSLLPPADVSRLLPRPRVIVAEFWADSVTPELLELLSGGDTLPHPHLKLVTPD